MITLHKNKSEVKSSMVALSVMVCTCWIVCYSVYLLACVSWCVLVGLCVMVCTCWLVCHGVYLLACVSWCVLVGLCVMVCTCWLVCHGVYLLACVSWCVLVGLCVMVCTCWVYIQGPKENSLRHHLLYPGYHLLVGAGKEGKDFGEGEASPVLPLR